MSEASDLPASKPSSRKKGCGCLVKSSAAAFVVVVVGFIIAAICSPKGGPNSIIHAQACATMEATHAIALSLHDYAVDHNGQYPTGNSSTEIFQKLMDGGYITDPSVLLVRWLRPNDVGLRVFTQKLKPENVSFDVTIPVDESSPSGLPVVFLTGYKVIYTPGASALPLSAAMKDRNPCMAVAYKDTTATYYGRDYFPRGYTSMNAGSPFDPGALPDGTIPNFIPSTLNLAGKKYQQLTPNGPLSP